MHNQLAQRLFVGLLIIAADGVKVSPSAHQKMVHLCLKMA